MDDQTKPAILESPEAITLEDQSPLTLLEAAGDGAKGVFAADGTVEMVLIRPCNGRGPGSHIYEADMLARNATHFARFNMFDNHDSKEAQRARGNMPRSVKDLMGQVLESRWDPAFTTPDDAKMGFDPGAVIGRCKLTKLMRDLVEEIPDAIKGSLNAQATSVRRGQRRGKKGLIVEGIVADPENSSFDLVTNAGAGGRVCSILEHAYDPSTETERLVKTPDLEPPVDTPDLKLTEALASPEGKALIKDLVESGVTEALASDATKTAISEAIESRVTEAVAEQRETITAELREEFAHPVRLSNLAAVADGLIRESRLSASAQNLLREDYGVKPAGDSVIPGRSLALIEAEYNADGDETKSAEDVLKDTLDADIKRQRAVISEARPATPFARGAGVDNSAAVTPEAAEPAWVADARSKGLDPSLYGAPAPAAPAAA